MSFQKCWLTIYPMSFFSSFSSFPESRLIFTCSFFAIRYYVSVACVSFRFLVKFWSYLACAFRMHILSFSVLHSKHLSRIKSVYMRINTMFWGLINIIITFMLMYVTNGVKKLFLTSKTIYRIEQRISFWFYTTEGDNFSLWYNEKLPFSLSVRNIISMGNPKIIASHNLSRKQLYK